MKRKINIAIDGYSSCGKSTLAKALAKKLRYVYIDSGAMYRAVTLFAMRNNIADNKLAIVSELPSIDIDFHFHPQKEISETILNGENVEQEIREINVSNLVSYVSQIHEVREKLVELQQKMSQRGGIVMDGRDIGSVVLPHAELKVFMTASHDVRTQRRYEELRLKGLEITKQEVSDNLKLRDYEDENRKESPLTRVPEARLLDNTNLSKDEQLELVLSWVEETTHVEASR
ncbi:MAG: (d)CMP kinase [Bacteroidia bacterium]